MPPPRFLKAFPTFPLPKQIKSSLFALHSRKRSKPACKLIQSGHVLFRSSRGLSGTHRNQVWMVGTTQVFTMPTIIHLYEAAHFLFVNTSILSAKLPVCLQQLKGLKYLFHRVVPFCLMQWQGHGILRRTEAASEIVEWRLNSD